MMRRLRPGTSRVFSRLRFRAIRGSFRAATLAIVAAGGLLAAGCEEILGPSGPPPVTLVEAGPNHTCAIIDGDRTYCWGDDRFGQLGADLDASCRGEECRRPIRLEGSLPFNDLALGEAHTCGVANLQLYCWGTARFGRLGDDHQVNEFCQETPAFRCAVVPRRAAIGLPMIAVTADGAHSCGLADTGQVFCWGRNLGLQLGTGDAESRTFPVEVESPAHFESVTTGTSHTCALAAPSDIYCWGQGGSGQLGTGDTRNRTLPARVESGVTRLWAAVEAGGGHSCAIETNGVVSCWGLGNEGQLGLGDRISRGRPAPVDVPGRTVDVSAGGFHSCAVTENGSLYCWGANNRGQLGIGPAGRRLVPVQVQLPMRAVAVSAGAAHTCAITEDRALYCWGANDSGQLGDGTRTQRTTPVRVDF